MRSEEEMFSLIIDTAKEDERIRAVIMNGSRANPNAPKDPFQDFDIVYLVTDLAAFRNNREWINRFGELMIMQMPEEMKDPPPDDDGWVVYLMQFSDGNRIDLSIHPIEDLDRQLDDSLSIILLDKDGLIGSIPEANESDYLPSPPTAKAFADCCNEFFWLCPYVAKGLWREQILYAKTCQNFDRNQLMKMIMWYAGLRTHFSINPGTFGKNLQQRLEPELWDLLQGTFSDASYDDTWDAMFNMIELFRRVARDVAENFGFEYPEDDDRRVSAHLEHVRRLPRDAKKIY